MRFSELLLNTEKDEIQQVTIEHRKDENQRVTIEHRKRLDSSYF